jgi:hypothetical protein
MEKYKIVTTSGYFGLGYTPETGETLIRQGGGKAPTLGEAKAALAALPKNAPEIDLSHPWRIVRREGMSGCRDYSLLEMYDTDFGFERRLASLHVSMEKKLNYGYRGPLALLQLALEEESPEEGAVQIEILPDEDTRIWNRGRPINLDDLRAALNGPQEEPAPEPHREAYGEE